MTGPVTRRAVLAASGAAALAAPAASAVPLPGEGRAAMARLAAPLPILPADMPLGAAAMPAAVEPDVALIRASADYIAALDTYDRCGGRLEPEDDPLWHAVEAAEAAMDAAEPTTLAGVHALAAVARHRAEKAGADWSDDFTGDLPARVCLALLALLPASLNGSAWCRAHELAVDGPAEGEP